MKSKAKMLRKYIGRYIHDLKVGKDFLKIKTGLAIKENNCEVVPSSKLRISEG